MSPMNRRTGTFETDCQSKEGCDPTIRIKVLSKTVRRRTVVSKVIITRNAVNMTVISKTL